MCSCDFFLALLALIFPPLPVWVKRGLCSADSVINILLCMLGFIPGLIHAWYIIVKFPEPEFDYEILDQDAEAGGVHGRVTYVVVNESGGRRKVTTVPPKPQNNMNYGATGTAPAPASASAASASAPAIAPAPAAAAAPSSSSSAAAAAAPAVAGPSTDDNGGEGGSDRPPPSYAQAVAGDNKIQSQD